MRQWQQKREIPAARLLRTRTTFTQSVMVSVHGSVKAGCYWSHLCGSGHQGERRILQSITLLLSHNVILQNSSHQICGHRTAQIWMLLTIKSGVWCSKGCANENSWHHRTEGASHRRVAWTAAVCRGWSHRWMAQAFASVCSCQRRTFRALNLDLMYTLCLGVGFIIDCISYLSVDCFMLPSTIFSKFVLVDDFWLFLDVYHGSVAT